MTTNTLPTYVTAVTLYGDFCSRSLPIREALDFAATYDVTLMLGAMREGYLGREVVTVADLERWLHEEESAAEWAAIEDGERYAAENGLLR
jgi:hypothetical protein